MYKKLYKIKVFPSAVLLGLSCDCNHWLTPGKGGKGEVGGSPTRMEQGFVMPATVGAYGESLYRNAQQTLPVPCTPSNSSRNQGKGSTSTPEQETASGQAYPGMCGQTGMPPTFVGKGVLTCREVLDLVRLGLSRRPCFQPPGFFQIQPNVTPQMFASVWILVWRFCGFVAQVPPDMPLFQGNGQQGPVLGDLTPQAQRMQQVLSMSQGLLSNQSVTLMQKSTRADEIASTFKPWTVWGNSESSKSFWVTDSGFGVFWWWCTQQS